MGFRTLLAVVIIFACGVLVGVGVMLPFVYGALSLTRGLPVLYEIWRLQPAARTALILVAVALVGTAAFAGAVARLFWLRTLRPRNLYQSNERVRLPEWFIDYAKLGVLLWPLFGVALAALLTISGGFLWLGVNIRVLFGNFNQARITWMIAAVLGGAVGFPTGFYWGTLLAARVVGRDIVDRIRF